eukprot:4275540-Pleurochrysis_carterae.AAC.2
MSITVVESMREGETSANQVDPERRGEREVRRAPDRKVNDPGELETGSFACEVVSGDASELRGDASGDAKLTVRRGGRREEGKGNKGVRGEPGREEGADREDRRERASERGSEVVR